MTRHQEQQLIIQILADAQRKRVEGHKEWELVEYLKSECKKEGVA